jgi:predicted RNase H-like HicB family nuclease
MWYNVAGGELMEYKINFSWDEEAGVWIAQSDDIPGLVLEGGSLDALIERVRFAAPELIELNKKPGINSLFFSVERHEKVFA